MWSHDLVVRAMVLSVFVGVAMVIIEALRLPPLYAPLSSLQLCLEDYFFELKDQYSPSADRKLSQEVILVCVDPDSRRRLGLDENAPWPRSVLALLVKKLTEAQADVIGFDLPLGEQSLLSNQELAKVCTLPYMSQLGIEQSDDDYLLAQLKKSKNIVLSSSTHMVDTGAPGGRVEKFQSPYGPFIESLGIDSGCVGNAMIPLDKDGLVRRAALVLEEFNPSGIFYKSFALRIAEKKLGSRALADTPEQVYLRKKVYPNEFRINYVGAPGSFKMVPLWRALEWQKHYARNGLFLPTVGAAADAASGEDRDVVGNHDALAQDNPFRHRIVIVGFFGDPAQQGLLHVGKRDGQIYSSAESFLTPASSAAQPMAAIEVQANIVSNILHDRFLTEPKEWEQLLLIAVVTLFFGRILGKYHGRLALTSSVLICFSILWLAISFVAYCVFHTLIPVVVPLLGVAFPAWLIATIDEDLQVKRERRRQTRIFRSLAAKPLAQEIERRLLAELGLEGKRMTVTLLACQVRNFVGDIDNENPEAVMERLNKSLALMMETIGEHHGMVERIWNCGVIGLFGAPIAMPEGVQAQRAAECALDIRKRLQALHATGNGDKPGELHFTCGINTGEAICGTINALAKDSNLTQYGALGPAVDVAVDLEALNVTYGTNFIVGSVTAQLLSGKMEVREVDRIALGLEQSTQSIFELLPWEGSLPGALEEAMALFKQGRAAMDEGKLNEAEQLFMNSLRMVPQDRPTMLMLQRCREQMGRATAGTGTQELVREKLSLKERLDGPN